MSQFNAFTPPQSTPALIARLQAAGFNPSQTDAIAGLLRLILLNTQVLADEGFDLPDELTNQLDDFDPDDASEPQGNIP